jgi:hypothetical protein
MVKPTKPPSQNWRTFLTNHAKDIASIDFFTVPTATFRVLYVFLVLDHARRRVLHFGVTQSSLRIEERSSTVRFSAGCIIGTIATRLRAI